MTTKTLLASLALATALTGWSASPLMAQDPRDDFDWLDRMNRASAVMLADQGVITPEQAKTIADTIEQVYALSSEPGFSRSGYHLGLEPLMIEIGGVDISRLHTGRSTIDMGRSGLRLRERDLLLSTYEQLINTRQALLDYAAKYPNAIVPGYTLGVQAQPISLGHYLTAYAGAFERHADYIEQTYDVVNYSPMGSAAMGTSSYPIDRQQLSDLLGFTAPIRNSFDSVHLATLESAMHIVGVTSAIAMTSSQLSSDLENQFRMVKPWFTFPYDLDGGSSIMPQKQNPGGVNSTRTGASDVVGIGAAYMFDSIKSASGDTDMIGEEPIEALTATTGVLKRIEDMFEVFEFHEDRALDVVLGDYATATELANTLQREANIPFREAHHIAALVVNFGRTNDLRPIDITYEDFKAVYAEAAEELQLPAELALGEESFLAALKPQNMVEKSQGFGGPQSSEVASMIEEMNSTVASDKAWLEQQQSALAEADAKLDEAFAALLK
ncbi:lyase family protein [Devosia ginsengisoli]|uniref:argininosuccinate lyase n=1 Tax=Devosia ginsengisoli TaxID=400770 RepID=A0A5B8LPI5_9HYPH|nr:lyase family protein [Devosia ginsengisoli]QDZ10006.1 argininosuccinate lyase [Devosia ginsengisoli]